MKRLLSPKSIAVVGGGAWCENVVRECQKIGFDGPIWPVHPKRDAIHGVPVHRSIADLLAAPDATFIGVNREATIEVVQALRDRDAGGAVCFASGFAEADAEMADGSALQKALLAAAGDMPILGPNCYGLLNLVDGTALWPDQHGAKRVERGVAIIAQSSNIGINMTMQKRGLPVAYVATVGNQAQMDMATVGMALLDDDRVTALGLYIEGISDLAAFEAMSVHARTLGKNIVALKVGASDQAQAAAISHTASFAGSAVGASALFRRLAIAEVDNLAAFLETLKVLHVIGPLSSNRIASMSCSGGEASLVADRALATGLTFPTPNAAQIAALSKALGPKVALANPLDYHTYIWADRQAMANCFAAMMLGDLALGFVVLDFPRADRCDASDWNIVIDAISDAIEISGKPIAMLASLPETMPEEIIEAAMQRGILAMSGLPEALAALDAAARLGQDRNASEALLMPTRDGADRTLSEFEAKAALRASGLNIPEGRRVTDLDALDGTISQLNAPFVLKGEGVAHKTEAAAVRLHLQDATEVENRARDMGAETFLVEEMVQGGVAELLIGVTMDPGHGVVLTLGAGGTLTEIMRDTQSMLLPVTENDVATAIDKLRIAPLLRGYRGGDKADIKEIVAAVMAVQSYVIDHRDVVLEVEVNPLIATPTSAIAVDALIRVKELS